MKTIRLKGSKERILLHGRPCVFDGAIACGIVDSGETVRVQTHDGRFLVNRRCPPKVQHLPAVYSLLPMAAM